MRHNRSTARYGCQSPPLLIGTMGCDGLINSRYNDDPGSEGQNIINITTTDNVRPNVTRHDAIVVQFFDWTLHKARARNCPRASSAATPLLRHHVGQLLFAAAKGTGSEP